MRSQVFLQVYYWKHLPTGRVGCVVTDGTGNCGGMFMPIAEAVRIWNTARPDLWAYSLEPL